MGMSQSSNVCIHVVNRCGLVGIGFHSLPNQPTVVFTTPFVQQIHSEFFSEHFEIASLCMSSRRDECVTFTLQYAAQHKRSNHSMSRLHRWRVSSRLQLPVDTRLVLCPKFGELGNLRSPFNPPYPLYCIYACTRSLSPSARRTCRKLSKSCSD